MASNLEKISRFLDALKASQNIGDAAQSTGAAGTPATSNPGIGQLSFPSSTEQFFEQTAAVASSLSQQGQTLLRSVTQLFYLLKSTNCNSGNTF